MPRHSESRVPSPESPDFELLASLQDLPNGGLLAVQKSNGERICLINHNGEIHAVSDNCTHQDFPMSEGHVPPSADGCVIECAWHGAAFDCLTGEVKRQPAMEPLPVYDVRVSDGKIYVGGRKN